MDGVVLSENPFCASEKVYPSEKQASKEHSNHIMHRSSLFTKPMPPHVWTDLYCGCPEQGGSDEEKYANTLFPTMPMAAETDLPVKSSLIRDNEDMIKKPVLAQDDKLPVDKLFTQRNEKVW